MKVKRKGMAASAVAVALGLSSALFRDTLVEIALLCVLVVIASEASWVKIATRRPESNISLTGDGPGVGAASAAVLLPGDESVGRVRLVKRIGGEVAFESRVPFLTISPKAVGAGARSLELEFRFRSQYAGEYSARDVGVEVTGPLGLFSSATAISLAQRYRVYPRLLSVARSTIQLLETRGSGEAPVDFPGLGSEFYEMREYHEGDDLRKVNWKATARRGRLVVNEYAREVGSSFLLMLDARAPGFFEADRLASTFLSVANDLAASGVNFGVMVHDGSSVVAASVEHDPRRSLEVALDAALSTAKLDSVEFLELIPLSKSPRPSPKGEGGGSASLLVQMHELRHAQLGSVLKDEDPWASASRYIRDRSTRRVVYVSGLFNGVEPLIELARRSRSYRDVDFTVVDPCVEVASGQSGGAPRLAARSEWLAKSLGSAGVKFFSGEPLDLAQRSLSA